MTTCRTCLSDQDLNDIFSIYSPHQLTLITGLKILPNDGCTEKICKECVKLANAAIKLRKQSACAEKILLIDMKIESKTRKLAEHYNNDDSNLESTNYFLSENEEETEKTTKYFKLNKISKSAAKQKSRHGIKKKKRENFAPKTRNIFDYSLDSLEGVPKTEQRFKDPDHDISNKTPNESLYLKSAYEVDEKLCQTILSCSKELEILLSGGKKNENNGLTKPFIPMKQKYTTTEMEAVYKILEEESKKKIDEINRIVDNENVTTDSKLHHKKKIEKLWSIAVKPINKNGLVKCSLCSKEFTFNYFLIHSTTHFDAEFICEVCGGRFPAAAALRYHQQRLHGAARRHACPDCRYSAVHREELKNHINRVHTGARPYICDICGDGFYQRRTIVQHMRKHYGVKTFKCDFCQKLYASRGQLTAHRSKFHLLRYIFFCYLCAYQSSGNSTVRNHLTKVHKVPRDQQKKIKFIKEKR